MEKSIKAKITINDVAKAAGVSISTVSHVLNETATISKETQRRVLDVVQKYNYVPNGYRTKGQSKKSKIIGVLVSELNNEFYVRCLQSIMDEALHENYATMICEMAFSYKKACMSIEALLENNVDGIIFLGGAMDANLILKAKKQVPVILGDRKMWGEDIASVTTDNINAMRLLIKQLCKWGYTKIGMISESADMDNLKDRNIGFKIGIEENDLSINKNHIILDKRLKLDKTKNSSLIIKEYLEKTKASDLPEVFLTTSDLIAAGAMAAFKKYGLRVPGDIGITGFDNVSIAESTDPPLTTVSQNTEAMGKACLRNIINIINQTTQISQHTVIDTEIIIRNSVQY